MHTPKELLLAPVGSMSLNNSLGVQDFRNNLVVSPSRDIMLNIRKVPEVVTSPEIHKLKYQHSVT